MSKRSRVIGTTEEAVRRAEEALNRTFPPSFRQWILQNNGRDLDGVTIFPVLDDRDPRKTWDSIDRNFRESWARWLANFEDEDHDFSNLLPFGDYGTGDYYCFDYAQPAGAGEVAVVRWSHETGEADFRAETFASFVRRLLEGEFRYD
jgi:cell wall assembly regulator SMI1